METYFLKRFCKAFHRFLNSNCFFPSCWLQSSGIISTALNAFNTEFFLLNTYLHTFAGWDTVTATASAQEVLRALRVGVQQHQLILPLWKLWIRKQNKTHGLYWTLTFIIINLFIDSYWFVVLTFYHVFILSKIGTASAARCHPPWYLEKARVSRGLLWRGRVFLGDCLPGHGSMQSTLCQRTQDPTRNIRAKQETTWSQCGKYAVNSLVNLCKL